MTHKNKRLCFQVIDFTLKMTQKIFVKINYLLIKHLFQNELHDIMIKKFFQKFIIPKKFKTIKTNFLNDRN
jgi:hypothetical protein